MNKRIKNVAGLLCGVAMCAGAAQAGDSVKYEGTCLASIAGYQMGLPAVESKADVSVEDKMIATTVVFRDAMSALRKVQACHDKSLAGKDAAENFAAVYTVAKEAGRVFSLVQAQFEETIEGMSGEVLSQVAPAAGAGPEADLIAENEALTGMEIVMDSYVALERSQVFAENFMKAAK